MRRLFSFFFTALAAGLLLAALGGPPVARAADGEIAIVAHPSVGTLDAAMLNRLYTGRAIEVAGSPVVVVNLPPGSPARQRFLERFLQQDEDRYRAYWTVRRHVGKGVPPRELHTAAEVLDFVQSTPGAIGYVEVTELRPGVKVLLRR